MAKIQILSNTNYQLENLLKSELIDSNRVQIAVAFLKKSGLDLVKKSLEFALNNDSNIEFIVGLDFKTTDYNALMELENIKAKYKNFNYYCFGDKENNYTSLIFHPKIYLFNNEKKFSSIIGSSNFTKGGLTTNFEVNTFFQESIKNHTYFSQLEAIYKEIKFQDSIFKPNEDYLKRYSLARKEIDKYNDKALKSKDIKQEIKNLEKEYKEFNTCKSKKVIIKRWYFLWR
jgi:HKD family nuclease